MGAPEARISHPSESSSRRRQIRVVTSSTPNLADVYREHIDFVIRTTRHLGVPDPYVEDVVHDVFVVVHRRLADYDGRATMRSWLYGIARRVVLHHKRGFTRARAREAQAPEPPQQIDAEEAVARRQAAQMVRDCLDALDPAQRTVFVLADIEGMSAPEIAQTVGAKLNTVYSRLRLGRQKFERALAQHSQADKGSTAR